MPTHIQVSTAWLADRLRTAASYIRTWNSPAAVADALSNLATELDAVTMFPPVTYTTVAGTTTVTGSFTAGSLTTPPTPAQELAQVVMDTKLALQRQPLEPTVEDLLEVLWARLLHGHVPVRSMLAELDWVLADGATCNADRCPLGTTVSHSHHGGRVSWG